MADVQEGDKASWKWGGSKIGPGDVTAVKDDKMTIESKGKPVSKGGSKDNPAVKVEGASRNPVVKRASELEVEGKGGDDQEEDEEEEEVPEEEEVEEEDGDEEAEEAGEEPDTSSGPGVTTRSRSKK